MRPVAAAAVAVAAPRSFVRVRINKGGPCPPLLILPNRALNYLDLN